MGQEKDMQKLMNYVDGFGFYEEKNKMRQEKDFRVCWFDRFGRKVRTQILVLRLFFFNPLGNLTVNLTYF